MAITPSRPAVAAKPEPFERHYSVPEISEMLNVSDGTVRNIFFDEPGVIKIGRASGLMGGRSKKVKRHYFTLRIPASVLARVLDRLMHKRPASGIGGGAPSLGGSGNDFHAAG